MKFSKKHHVAGLIGNLIVSVVSLIGIVMLLLEFPGNPSVFYYFTTLSNIFVCVVSLINFFVYLVSIAKSKSYVKEALQVIKMIAVASVAITFTMVLVFLMPHNTTGFDLFAGSQLFLHVITPLVAVASFVFLEYQTKIRFRFFFMPFIVVVVYGAFYIIYAFNASTGSAVDWYGFMFSDGNRVAPVDVSNFTAGNFAIFLSESIGGAVVFGFVLWLLNKIMNLIFIGYTVEEEEYFDEVDEKAVQEEDAKVVEEEIKEAKEETKKTTSKKSTTAKSTTKKAPAKKAPVNNKYKDSARVYHIARSKFVSRHWQVKLAGGEKAIKIFPTQAEAIEFAKGLVRSQGGSIRIHSMKGQLRK